VQALKSVKLIRNKAARGRRFGGRSLESLKLGSNIHTLKAHMTPRQRYGFWIDASQREGLRAVKERDGVLESEQIRRAINDWLQKKGVVKAERKRTSMRKRP
jgi:hypothetical protein